MLKMRRGRGKSEGEGDGVWGTEKEEGVIAVGVPMKVVLLTTFPWWQLTL